MSSILTVSGRFLPKGRFAREVAVLTTGTAASQAITLLTLPLLTRLYKPEEFGVLAVFVGILGIVTVVASFRYELAIPLPLRDGAALHVVALSIIVVCVVSILAAGLAFAAKPFLPVSLDGFVPETFVALLTIGVLTVGFYQIGNYWAVRRKDFGVITRTRLQQGVGSAASQIILGLLHSGAVGLIVGQIIGQAAGLVRLAANLRKDHTASAMRIRLRGVRWALRRYRRFPLYDSWAALLNVASAQAPALLFAALFSPQLAGYYVLASRILSAPIGLIGTSISQVLLPRIVEGRRNGELPRLIRTAQRFLARAVFVPFSVFIALAPEFFGTAFGAAWGGAGRVAAWTALWIACQFIYAPLSVLIIGMEAQATNLLLQIVFFVARLGAIGIGYHFGSADQAVMLYSLVSMVCYLSALIVISRLAGVRILDEVRDLSCDAFVGLLALFVITQALRVGGWAVAVASIGTALVYMYQLKRLTEIKKAIAQ